MKSKNVHKSVKRFDTTTEKKLENDKDLIAIDRKIRNTIAKCEKVIKSIDSYIKKHRSEK